MNSEREHNAGDREVMLAKKRSRLGVIDALSCASDDERLGRLRLVAEVDLELSNVPPVASVASGPGRVSGPDPAQPLDEQIDLVLSRV